MEVNAVWLAAAAALRAYGRLAVAGGISNGSTVTGSANQRTGNGHSFGRLHAVGNADYSTFYGYDIVAGSQRHEAGETADLRGRADRRRTTALGLSPVTEIPTTSREANCLPHLPGRQR